MIRNVWSVLCKTIITDQETNAVSYIHSIEEGSASSLPTVISPIVVGTLWEKDSEQEEVLLARIVFALPSGTERLLLQTRPLSISQPRQRVHFKLEGISITESGRHEIRVEARAQDGWYIVSRLPFMIKQLADNPTE